MLTFFSRYGSATAPFLWSPDGAPAGGSAPAAQPAGGGAPAAQGSAAPPAGNGAGPAATTPDDPVKAAVAKALEEERARNKRELDEAARKAAEEKMVAEQKWEQLAKQREQEMLALKLKTATQDALGINGLSEFAPVFESDFGTIEGRTNAAKAIKQLVDQRVAAEVAKRLTTEVPGKGAPDATPGTYTPEQIEKMPMDEYVRLRNEGKIK